MLGTRTTPIADRDDENRRRSVRMKQMKRGPGMFVYEGGHFVTEHFPTIKRMTKEEPIVDDDDAIAVDANGLPRMRNVGEIVKDHLGRPALGGKPKAVRKELEHFSLWGVDFPRGVPVSVSAALALKLRCCGVCRELEGDELDAVSGDGEGASEAPKRGRKGRRASTEPSGDGEGASED